MAMRADKNISDLINSCQGLVRSLAWKIHRRVHAHADLDDLIGYGQVGLAEAARDFDPDRGVQFTTFAYYRVRGAILDGLSTMSWFNKADYSRGRYETMANDVLGDGASDGDTVYDDARWFRQATGSLAVVYLMSQQAAPTGRTPDYADGNAPDPETPVELSDLAGRLQQLISELPDDAQSLVRGVYYEGLTIKEAGERFGISKAWASRLHSRALEKLAFGLTEYN